MIYVHVPFCRSFCTYCDFYSEIAGRCCGGSGVGPGGDMYDVYADALAREVSLRGMDISDRVNTLYIGGGTPSVLPLSFFHRLLEALGDVGHGGPFDEFTVEVNPDDIVEKGAGYVEGLLRLGVSRFSMGVQSFDDNMLRWMNRRHDSAVARKAYSILEDAGARNIGIDLIFGISGLSDEVWIDTLDKALSISPGGHLPKHLSSYQLSVEPGSALASLVCSGKYEEASDEACRRQYDILCGVMKSAGYRHYEVSNFALPGFEALHNGAYWRHVPYVGFGPGAHSLSCAGPFVRKWNDPDLSAYVKAAGDRDFDRAGGYEELSPEQIATEKIMLGLRTDDGVGYEYLIEHCDRMALDRAVSSGLLIKAPSGKIYIPEEHYFVSDGIISDIL